LNGSGIKSVSKIKEGTFELFTIVRLGLKKCSGRAGFV